MTIFREPRSSMCQQPHGAIFWVALLIVFSARNYVFAQTNLAAPAVQTNNLLVMIQGKVEVARTGTDAWTDGRLNQVLFAGDRVRTGERSRAGIYLAVGMTFEKG